uniref:RRM domain-containing protein n=1 Tax=Graphocephala atropunctata TaxID=36148 RepID=A0A1B6KK18_9HEMI
MSNKSSNLIVNYLPQNMTDRELYSMFVTIGPVESCRVMKDFKTGYSYGFGFVNYNHPVDAERAIQQLNGQEIFNKRIKVSYARPSGDDIKDTNLYVTNLPRNYTEQNLEMLFGQFGTIVQKNLLLDKLTGLPRGVAFVRFDRREEAQEAIRNLDGVVPDGGNERLSVRVAEEHGKQKAAYFAGWQAGMQQSRVQQAAPQARNVHEVPRKPGGRFEGVRGGRGGASRGNGGAERGHGRGGMRGGRNNANSFNNHLVTYPIRTNAGFGALRQEKLQQRYNPIAFGLPNNGYAAF